MGALNPLFLLAAAAAAVPILLHILQRHTGRRAPFPALRYLRRVTREQARSVRLRQLLLLALRVAALLMIVGGGARLYLDVRAGDHEATALAIVVDNSMSSAAVQGEERVLDRIRRHALRSVDEAGPDDRIWVFPASEPWELTLPGGREAARRRLEAMEPTDAPARLAEVVERAAGAVAAAGLPGAEVHLYSDLQATALPSEGLGERTGDVPLVARGLEARPPPNRWVREVLVGGGLPPLEGEGSEVAVEVRAEADGVQPSEAPPVPVRVEVGGELVGTREVVPGETAVVPVGPFASGWVTGHAETDPDALRRDDRRYFAFRLREAPTVALVGPVGEFVEEAVATLEAAGRLEISRDEGTPADVVVDAAGRDAAPPAQARVLVPPADPGRLPAFNRSLADAGIPWEVAVRERAGGAVALGSWELPMDPDEVSVTSLYRLRPRDEAPAPGSAPAMLADDSPWSVAGRDADDTPYLLVGTPLEPEHTNLPVSPAMIPFIDWMVSGWQNGGGGRSLTAGDPMALPGGVTGVEDPSGTLHATDGTPVFAKTGEAGIYRLLAGDVVLEKVAVNPPEAESRLARLEGDAARARLGPGVELVESDAEWAGEAFGARRGLEVWRPLLLGALLLLLVEAWAAGGSARGARPAKPVGTPAPGAEPQSGGT